MVIQNLYEAVHNDNTQFTFLLLSEFVCPVGLRCLLFTSFRFAVSTLFEVLNVRSATSLSIEAKFSRFWFVTKKRLPIKVTRMGKIINVVLCSNIACDSKFA